MKIERTKNATRNIFFGVLLKIYQIVVPFLMRTAMIYFMGVQYLGLDSLFTSILQVLNLAELGVGSAMVYSMYKPIAMDDSISICALMRLYKIYYHVIGGVIAILGFALTPFIPRLVKSDLPPELNIYILYYINLGVTVLSYWLFAYKNSLFEAHQRDDIISKITFLTNTIRYSLQLIVIVFTKNYYLYIMMALFTQILTNLFTAIVATREYPDYKPYGKINKKEVHLLNGRIRDLFTAKFGGVIVNSADTIVISTFLGLTALAIYQNYYYIILSLIGLFNIIFSACRAGIGNSLIVESHEKNLRDLKKMSMLIWLFLDCCVSCLLCLFQPFMKIWVGQNLMLDSYMVFLFCIYFFIYIMQSFFSMYKDAAGIWHQDRFRPLIEALLNLVLNLLTVKFLGMYGILLSTILSMGVLSFPWLFKNLFNSLFRGGEKDYVILFLKNIVLIFITAIVLYAICNLITIGGIIEIIIKLIISSSVSTISYVLVMRKNIYFKELIKMIDFMSGEKIRHLLTVINFNKRN